MHRYFRFTEGDDDQATPKKHLFIHLIERSQPTQQDVICRLFELLLSAGGCDRFPSSGFLCNNGLVRVPEALPSDTLHLGFVLCGEPEVCPFPGAR